MSIDLKKIPPGENATAYSPITQFKMNNPIPEGQFRESFQLRDRVVYATAPIASRFKMNAVRLDFDMGLFDYGNLMLNLECVPGATIQVVDV